MDTQAQDELGYEHYGNLLDELSTKDAEIAELREEYEMIIDGLRYQLGLHSDGVWVRLDDHNTEIDELREEYEMIIDGLRYQMGLPKLEAGR